MNFEFLPEADEEFREASRYYENEAPDPAAWAYNRFHGMASTSSLSQRGCSTAQMTAPAPT